MSGNRPNEAVHTRTEKHNLFPFAYGYLKVLLNQFNAAEIHGNRINGTRTVQNGRIPGSVFRAEPDHRGSLCGEGCAGACAACAEREGISRSKAYRFTEKEAGNDSLPLYFSGASCHRMHSRPTCVRINSSRNSGQYPAHAGASSRRKTRKAGIDSRYASV